MVVRDMSAFCMWLNEDNEGDGDDGACIHSCTVVSYPRALMLALLRWSALRSSPALSLLPRSSPSLPA